MRLILPRILHLCWVDLDKCGDLVVGLEVVAGGGGGRGAVHAGAGLPDQLLQAHILPRLGSRQVEAHHADLPGLQQQLLQLQCSKD